MKIEVTFIEAAEKSTCLSACSHLSKRAEFYAVADVAEIQVVNVRNLFMSPGQ